MDENVRVENGSVFLDVKNEDATWYHHEKKYTSGMIHLKETFNDYAKFEIRCKIPTGLGYWSAFWMFGWSTELDVFEAYGVADLFESSVHFWIDSDTRKGWTKEIDTNINLFQEFHTYAVEYDENRVKFLFDGNVVAKYPRLLDLSGSSMNGCSSLTDKMYLLNPYYPKYGNPLSITANVALNAYWAGIEWVPEGTMEIDYIKVYERINFCPDFEDLVIVDQDETWTSDRDIKVLIVKEDVTLNLDDCTIEFRENGRIYLEEGANLIMESAILTSCSPEVKWEGIRAEDKAYIDMNSWSRIENATTGVHLGPRRNSSSGQIIWDDTPTIEVSSYSGFKNCDLGIYLGYGLTASKIGGRSWFEDCGTAIFANQSSGLALDRVEFYDNSESIRALDSYIHVRDGNAFHGGETGISIEGTFPGSSGIDIGDMGQGYNYFASEMENGIICQGTEHPVGANIVNCRFSNVTQLATGFNGSNQYMYYNNLVENSPNGVLSGSTGDNFNMTRCNEFKNISNADNLYIFNNNRTQFLENLSSGTHNVNYGFLSATMPNDIGSPNNPAGNCFSDNGVDIRTPLNPFVPGNQFNYHYYDDVNANPCQEPMNNGNYTKLESDFEPDHCGGDIGIFRLIDPDSDGVKGFVPDTNVASFSSHIPKDSISTQILHWITEVISEGGDDPRTPANEESTSVTPLRSKKEAVLDQWIRYAIYRGNEEGECAFVDSILSPLSTFRWQKRRYGQKIMCGDIDGASRLLDSIPSGNPDIVAFKTVQNINLKRLRGFGEGNWLTEAEITNLQSIGESELPSSGYARSLYRLLTGNNLPFNIPDMNADTSIVATPKISSSTIGLTEKVNIFPNPSSDIIYIQSDHEISNVVISDITGKVKISKNYSSELNVSSLPKGVYLVSLHYIDGRVSTHKVLIN